MNSHSSSLADDYYSRSPSQTPPRSDTPVTSRPPLQNAHKQPSLARIVVPSFSAFRSQVPARPDSAFRSSPRNASFSLSEKASPRFVEPETRPLSLGSPIPTHPSGLVTAASLIPPGEGESQQEERYVQCDTQRSTGTSSPKRRPSHAHRRRYHERNESIDSRIEGSVASSAYSQSPRSSGVLTREGHAHAKRISNADIHSTVSTGDGAQYASGQGQPGTSMNAKKAPAMTLQQSNGVQRKFSNDSLPEPPKSPIGRLGNLLGWKSPGKSEGETSPTTTFSERSLSPLPSPRVRNLAMENSSSPARLTPPGIDIQKSMADNAYYDKPDLPLLPGSDANNAHVRELERELSHISQELAGSIRREMELEDELDRMRAEFPSAPQSETGHRSSDYFSDSGASSVRFPITDVDGKLEQLEKQVRKVEQEKANLKVDSASRLQTELGRRRDLEEMVRDLEEQLDKKRSGGDLQEKLAELEFTLDETRRRLNQEKEAKENFEDLYSATREELEKHRNERDSLRDGNTRMQQELKAYQSRFGSFGESIAEEGSEFDMRTPRIGLSRSGSLARNTSVRRGGGMNQSRERPEGGRQRSGSNSFAPPDAWTEIEDQRNALHKALQLLIKRHEKQQRDHARVVKSLTSAKTRAELVSPNRSGYNKEVTFLKEEVTVLRKRTEDALEQKWQYEKGLSGLKMDLDAAEQETRGLRILLQGHDITSSPPRKQLGGNGSLQDKADSLKQSIATAESERDQARKVAEDYRKRARQTSGNKSQQLMSSAKRMDELAAQLEAQVQSSLQLRERLAQAVAKGEQQQKQSTRQIEEMQKRLAGMEDSVLAAQQHSENTLATHDAESRKIEDATSPRLQRLRIDVPEANRLSPHSPLFKKSPKLLSKKLSESSLLEMSRTQMLERKVKELEGLLREAEEDVQTVVARVNRSQMEVADLQTERDAALTQMHKLQALVVQERDRAATLM